MLTVGKSFGTDRLVDLERTVDSLNGQLREMQWDLYRAKAEPLSGSVVAESGEFQRRAGVHVSRLQSARSSEHKDGVSCSPKSVGQTCDSPAPVLTVERWSSAELPASMG